jgi:hypothetical protein
MADMDIDMDLDLGLMDEEATGPEMEIIPEIQAPVSSLQAFLFIFAAQADVPRTRLLNNSLTQVVLTIHPKKTLFDPTHRRFTSAGWTILPPKI